jgi:hypothetical protein
MDAHGSQDEGNGRERAKERGVEAVGARGLAHHLLDRPTLAIGRSWSSEASAGHEGTIGCSSPLVQSWEKHMMRRTTRLCCLLGAVSCSAAGGPQSPPIEDFYCETSYTNFAWGYQHHGTYVDGQGRIFAFGSESPDTRGRQWAPKQPDAPIQQELEDKYSLNRHQRGTVEAQKIVEVRGWLAAARSGSLSKKVQKGADMGSSASVCWVREAGGGHYQLIELEVSGDWSYRNTAAAAAELARWLASVDQNGRNKAP